MRPQSVQTRKKDNMTKFKAPGVDAFCRARETVNTRDCSTNAQNVAKSIHLLQMHFDMEATPL